MTVFVISVTKYNIFKRWLMLTNLISFFRGGLESVCLYIVVMWLNVICDLLLAALHWFVFSFYLKYIIDYVCVCIIIIFCYILLHYVSLFGATSSKIPQESVWILMLDQLTSMRLEPVSWTNESMNCAAYNLQYWSIENTTS